jgi:Mn2+/Fe2+ NRAMP family transporter
MADIPEGVVLERSRDLTGRSHHPYYRRLLLALIAVLPVLALLGVFGQKPSTISTNAGTASLSVTAPSRLRSGLIFQVKVKVMAHRQIKKPEIVFDEGWWESMSVNSIEPEPSEASSKDGRVVLSYGKLEPGESLTSWIYFQVNPTNVGKRREDVEVDDGETPLVGVHHSLTIFP